MPLTGHPGAGDANGVESVAFTPDGKVVASGAHDHTIIFWDAATRKQIGSPLADLNGQTCRRDDQGRPEGRPTRSAPSPSLQTDSPSRGNRRQRAQHPPLALDLRSPSAPGSPAPSGTPLRAHEESPRRRLPPQRHPPRLGQRRRHPAPLGRRHRKAASSRTARRTERLPAPAPRWPTTGSRSGPSPSARTGDRRHRRRLRHPPPVGRGAGTMRAQAPPASSQEFQDSQGHAHASPPSPSARTGGPSPPGPRTAPYASGRPRPCSPAGSPAGARGGRAPGGLQRRRGHPRPGANDRTIWLWDVETRLPSASPSPATPTRCGTSPSAPP